jgi:hypothetical protein
LAFDTFANACLADRHRWSTFFVSQQQKYRSDELLD